MVAKEEEETKPLIAKGADGKGDVEGNGKAPLPYKLLGLGTTALVIVYCECWSALCGRKARRWRCATARERASACCPL